MSFNDDLNELAKKCTANKTKLGPHPSEAEVVAALVYPFIQTLAYDLSDPNDVKHQFSIPNAQGKVDLALQPQDNVSIIIECKLLGANLHDDNVWRQLNRYFTLSGGSIHVGIITDGIIYRLYSDLDNTTQMDKEPFLEVDILNITDQQIPTLEMLTKPQFNVDIIKKQAGRVKYVHAMENEFRNELTNPSVDFVKLLTKRMYSGNLTEPIIRQFTEYMRTASSHLLHAPTTQLETDITSAAEQSKKIDALHAQALETVRRIVADMGYVDHIGLNPTQQSMVVKLFKNKQHTGTSYNICKLFFKDTDAPRVQLYYPDPARNNLKVFPLADIVDIRSYKDNIRDRYSLLLKKVG